MILDFQEPNNKDELLSYLGLIKTLQKWSGGLTLITEKGRELTKSASTWSWDGEHREEFSAAKEHLKENIKLHRYDKDLPTNVYYDAAKTAGLGYVLTQPDKKKNRENILYCGSTRLTDAQKRWAMCEIEMAAIVYALVNAKHLTYGANDIRIYTDHQPLIRVGKKCFDDIDNPRLVKMLELICHYNFELVHIPGKENIPADVLSRLDHTTREMPDIALHK